MVVMGVVLVVMMVAMRCERRTGKHHQEQCDG
jgi:hypothetical protein